MDKVRIGIIGVGNMGTSHITSVQNIPQAELAAICDRDRARADEKVKLAPAGCRVFYSVDDLLDSGTVDAVIISVPHYDHTPIAIQAFEKGNPRALREAGRGDKSRAQKMIDAHAKHPNSVSPSCSTSAPVRRTGRSSR